MPGQTVDEIKYIVFRSLLLELFTHCPSCHNVCAGEVAYVQGTFIAVKQQCSHCEHKDSGQANHISKTFLLETFYCQQLYFLVELL